MSRFSGRIIGWCVLLLIGAGLALAVAWFAHVVRVPLTALLWLAAVVVGLCWLVLLVTLPWNLYFAARRALTAMAVSRQRGITVHAADEAEAARLARRMLASALGAHACTALAAAVIAYVAGAQPGYYVAGFYLLATVFRPAAAYFGHVGARIGALTRESTHPRDDVATVLANVEQIDAAVDELRADLRAAAEDLRLTDARLTGGIAHARQLLTTDLTRLQDAQAADRTACRARHQELGYRIDEMVRRIEATLDGLSDHQELLAGLRALVRMVRSDQA